ncbi:Uncharacterised protein [Klebsiella pneumoniae]|uniref:Uncharacterized protein n=1 Tax=Klebsiella pneumoniae TaxID=573 RepID=A0A2X1QCE7_KLEPN|nr:Uncharacterised protein [Klebsiella pneumoniae]
MRTGSHLEYGGEGGIDSLRSPLRGSPLAGSRSVQLAAPVVEPRSGVLIPPAENIKEKSPYLRTGSHLEYGGEGGIDSLRSPLRGSPLAGSRSVHWLRQLSNPRYVAVYTLSRRAPSATRHLTILSFPLLSGTGANVGKYVSPVNQLFAKKARLDKLRATCSLNVRNPFFFVASSFSLFARGKFVMLANQ